MERGEAPAGAVTPRGGRVSRPPGRFSGWHPRRCAASSADFQIFRFSVLHPPQRGGKDGEKLPSCHPPWDRGGTGRPPFTLPTEGHPSGSF